MLFRSITIRDYVAGKWGRYLRAPDLYFEIMDRYRNRFVTLGSVVDVRRGITSGCDAFFMPRDVTSETLFKRTDDKEFKKFIGAPRGDVVNGNLRIIKDGAGSLHAIETKFLRPEVQSLMKVDRPEVKAQDVDRVVLIAPGPLSALRGTYAHRYVKYGETATYPSRKSKPVPLPERSTCAAREPWYDLTKLVDPGFAMWSKSQQYRHIVPANPNHLVANPLHS